MHVFTFHLADVSFYKGLSYLLNPSKKIICPGLVHGELLNTMTLGAPVFSVSRIMANKIAFFGQWADDAAVDSFLESQGLGSVFSAGWHVRMQFLRQWGQIDCMNLTEPIQSVNGNSSTVVAVTLARLRPSQLPRFIQWGRPAEILVRDHPCLLYTSPSPRD